MRQRTLIRRKAAPPRGVLQGVTMSAARSRHVRYHPSPDLEPYVEHYWSVEWDYRGAEPERVEILPHPSVHMTFELRSDGRIRGVTRGKFARLLNDRGGVFGVKFVPGGFHPFLRAPISTLTDRTTSIAAVFGDAGVALARAMRARRTDRSRIALVEEFLRTHRPEPDDNVGRVAALVEAVRTDRSILTVEDLAGRQRTNTRALQRLFAQYVGVGPKWVIQRYRLHEAAERLASGAVQPAELALDLGYADQAHFVHDFKAVVGKPPAAYAKSVGAGARADSAAGGADRPPSLLS